MEGLCRMHPPKQDVRETSSACLLGYDETMAYGLENVSSERRGSRVHAVASRNLHDSCKTAHSPFKGIHQRSTFIIRRPTVPTIHPCPECRRQTVRKVPSDPGIHQEKAPGENSVKVPTFSAKVLKSLHFLRSSENPLAPPRHFTIFFEFRDISEHSLTSLTCGYWVNMRAIQVIQG